jgi:hypothetical protein
MLMMIVMMNLFSSQVLLESFLEGTTSSGYGGTHLGEANFVTEIHHWTHRWWALESVRTWDHLQFRNSAVNR